MKNRWFRFYDSALDDPKVQLLDPALFKHWVNLLCFASKNDGVVTAGETVSFALRVTVDVAVDVVSRLVAVGLLDPLPGGNYEPHNWGERQFKHDSSTNRVKRFRERQRNGGETVSPTVPGTQSVTAPETDTETERKRTNERVIVGRECAPDGALLPAKAAIPLDRIKKFAEFWEAYPHKVGKRAAILAFERVAKSKTVTFADLMAGLDRYVRKTDDRPWCNPATWLNQGRWDDKPAANGGKNDRPTIIDALNAQRDAIQQLRQESGSGGMDYEPDLGLDRGLPPRRLSGPQ